MASDKHALREGPNRRLEDRILVAFKQADAEGEFEVADYLLRALETLASRESDKRITEPLTARARDEAYFKVAAPPADGG